MPDSLRPAVAPELLYPADAVYAARTTLFETRYVGLTELQLDTVTTSTVGLLNGRTAIRHTAGTGRDVFDLYQRAGLVVDERTHSYQTQEEAEALADAQVAAGKRLFWPYPPPEGRYPEYAHLVSPDLYRYLNAKANLQAIVPAQHVPRRQILSHEQLAEFQPSRPVFLKAAGFAATGTGFAVRPCPDQASFDAARQWFGSHRERVPSVIVEDEVKVERCWCAGIAISDYRTICFGGAEQLFDAPARQCGSIVDPGAAFPATARALAETVGDNARRLGFRGIAGLDIGLGVDGNLVVFDPNFRINASSSQLLLHDSAAARSDRPVSLSFQVTPRGPFEQLAARLAGPIDEASFVPTRVFNATRHPLAAAQHIVTGFVLGRDRAEASTVAERLRGILTAD